MTTNEEEILINSINNGDTQAYAHLVNHYKDLVFSLALKLLKNREEAEEVAQDAFIKVFKSLNSFKGDSKFSTWIYRITYNTCLDRIKKNKRYQKDVPIDEFIFNKLDTIDNALDNMIAEERYTLIKNCINKLPETDAAILTLFYFEELTLIEIGDIISLEVNTVKVKLFRARKKLAFIMEKYVHLQNV